MFGFDFSFAPPFAERGAYLPGEAGVPQTAREFWAYVDRLSDDEDCGAASFLEQAHRRHFYFGIADGVKAEFVRFRICDARLNAQGGRKSASAYDAIGAAQVAKASFSGMRLLHRLDGKVAIWPMDPIPNEGSAVVEIYTRIYLRMAGMPGKKLRSRAELNLALKGLVSLPTQLRFEPDDHQTDALVTAAGMRALARSEPRAFAPERPERRTCPHRRLDVRHLLKRGLRVAGLAQLVEQRFCKPKVAGSNPASGTIATRRLSGDYRAWRSRSQCGALANNRLHALEVLNLKETGDIAVGCAEGLGEQ